MVLSGICWIMASSPWDGRFPPSYGGAKELAYPGGRKHRENAPEDDASHRPRRPAPAEPGADIAKHRQAQQRGDGDSGDGARRTGAGGQSRRSGGEGKGGEDGVGHGGRKITKKKET